jgi:hypothetical protein
MIPHSRAGRYSPVVFTDVVGSTALGEQLDPESLRRVMWRYFDAMQATLERHGGTVEKFIGDAIVAVFGVPAVHEDDALRAVRAAFEMREALDRVNEDLAREYGIRISTRTGVNTGDPAWKVAGALLLARRGETEEAVGLAREAIASMADSDNITAHAEIPVDFADVLRAQNDLVGAADALAAAVALHEEKGNVLSAERCRQLRAAIPTEGPAATPG